MNFIGLDSLLEIFIIYGSLGAVVLGLVASYRVHQFYALLRDYNDDANSHTNDVTGNDEVTN